MGMLSTQCIHSANPCMPAPERTLVLGLFLGGGGGSQHGKLAKQSHQMALEKTLGMALEKTLGINNQSCPTLRLSHKAMW